MSWVMSDGYPVQDTLGSLVDVFVSPYPESIFISNNEYPYMPGLTDMVKIFEEPYPESVFIQGEEETPRYAHLDIVNSGAFMKTHFLSKIVIPSSVTYIGEYAFRESSIGQVDIPATCTYFPTSFPEGCYINLIE